MDRQLELEFWVDVPEYEGLYEVSSLGRVRSLNYGQTGQVRELKQKKDKDGYYDLGLRKNRKQKWLRVHRLVWTGFVGQIPEGYEIDHIDGNPSNNRLNNLRCVTPKENSRNPITRQRQLDGIKRRSNDQVWRKKNAEANRRKANNKPIIQMDKTTGQVIRRWYSAVEAARQLGVKVQSISACCHGKHKTAGGFKWCFFMPPALTFGHEIQPGMI